MAGDKKVANGLVAVSCAAVLSVYAAGYSRTKAAATELEAKSERRPAPRAAVAERIVEPEIAAITTEPVVAGAREVRVATVDVAVPGPAASAATVQEAPAVVAEVAPAVPVAAQPAPVAAVVAPDACGRSCCSAAASSSRSQVERRYVSGLGILAPWRHSGAGGDRRREDSQRQHRAMQHALFVRRYRHVAAPTRDTPES